MENEKLIDRLREDMDAAWVTYRAAVKCDNWEEIDAAWRTWDKIRLLLEAAEAADFTEIMAASKAALKAVLKAKAKEAAEVVTRFTRHYNPQNSPTDWVTDTEDSHADHSSEVGPLMEEDYAAWARELWLCYAGDERPEKNYRAGFVDWLRGWGETVADQIEWS